MTDPRDRELFEKLADYLQTAAPLVSRLHVVAKQQAADARNALTAVEHAVAVLRSKLDREKGEA